MRAVPPYKDLTFSHQIIVHLTTESIRKVFKQVYSVKKNEHCANLEIVQTMVNSIVIYKSYIHTMPVRNEKFYGFQKHFKELKSSKYKIQLRNI